VLPRSFNGDPEEIKSHLEQLGGLVESIILDSLEALHSGDMETSRHILEREREIQKKRYLIEEKALALIIGRKPTAWDLRFAKSVIHIAGELDRMGDYARGIAVIGLGSRNDRSLAIPVELTEMALKATDMLKRALHAFLTEDSELARKISEEDDENDQFYQQTYQALAKMVIANPRKIDGVDRLFRVAYNLEWLGDRVTHICERTLFLVSGDYMELHD